MKRLPLIAMLITGLAADAQTTEELLAVPYRPNLVPELTDDGAQYNERLSDARRPPEWFLGIYSGSTVSTYFYVASGICEVLSANFAQHRIHCAALQSEGSQENIHLMNGGQAQSILVRGDAEAGYSEDASMIPRARFGTALINHAGVMVVARNSGIDSIADLRGKRINLGVEGSTTRQLWQNLLAANGLSSADLGEVRNATRDDNLRSLCSGEIDAFLSLIGLISPALIETAARCGARVVSFEEDDQIAGVVEPFDPEAGTDTAATQLEIPGAFDFEVSLLFHEELPAYVTCHLTRVLFGNPQILLAQHLALSIQDPAEMLAADHEMPLHPGVEQYLKERNCAEVPTVSPDFPSLRMELGDSPD
ncbi:TAXI family TRAP transporter solute-binding subunit [Ruegeria sp. 2205SS24-7]|uniref:TAXI family TRAP transporter solute-binding subunit n=1 Tax=Ruegeria discodermiae TaxID=3064389 RepID=UPI002741426F|nr:TAXI family TRAP transporter solute-binding subunit [Ruegeria sp. 2205SS24-7]MDP5218856.1 TAXI family TRAP transporter solute-binding subunit [Ruegeria sp. 2205SS24-7]